MRSGFTKGYHMEFKPDLIIPPADTISRIQEKGQPENRNIVVYSYRDSRKSEYISHIFTIDAKQTGEEIIYAPDGTIVAQFPLYQGKAHGLGQTRNFQDQMVQTYFYYGEIFPPPINANIVENDCDEIIINMSANLTSYDKDQLMKKELPTYITQHPVAVVFRPVAQNTVIRPMAQAVCMAHGGEKIPYKDTTDHKEKEVNISDLHFLTLTTKINGHEQLLDGYRVALAAKQTPIQIRVDVNDVQVFVSRDTTLAGAMADFYQKVNPGYNYALNREAESRQHE